MKCRSTNLKKFSKIEQDAAPGPTASRSSACPFSKREGQNSRQRHTQRFYPHPKSHPNLHFLKGVDARALKGGREGNNRKITCQFNLVKNYAKFIFPTFIINFNNNSFSITLLNGLQCPSFSSVHPYCQARNCWLRDSHLGKFGAPHLTKLRFSKAPPRCGAFENEDVAANACGPMKCGRDAMGHSASRLARASEISTQ